MRWFKSLFHLVVLSTGLVVAASLLSGSTAATSSGHAERPSSDAGQVLVSEFRAAKLCMSGVAADSVSAFASPACFNTSGPLAGARISLPRASGYMPARTYGNLKNATGAKVAGTRVRVLRSMAKEYKVPWPCRNCASSTIMKRHGMYQIYTKKATPGGERLYKYGITRVGPKRPKSQIAKCTKVMGVNCTWKWIRKDIKGWRRARQWEAGYTARFKGRKGHCPKGMPTCR